MFQERIYEQYNSTLPFKPENIEFVVVTHNHCDHTGRLPLLTRKGYFGNYFCTESTAKLLPLGLSDSLKILKTDAIRKKEKPIYNGDDLAETLAKCYALPYGHWEKVHPNVSLMFFRNNHLVGAATTLIKISYPNWEDSYILFTGDWNEKNIFMKAVRLPKWVKELPNLIIVQEATYGSTYQDASPACFKRNVSNMVKKGGNVIIPVFSLGRAQEILYNLRKMQDEERLSVNIPIYFAGKLAMAYTRLYHDGQLEEIREEMRDFLPENLNYLNGDARIRLHSPEQAIYVTTGGMGSHGISPMYISHFLPNPNALIQFTGYCAEGTLGRRLFETECGSEVKIAGKSVQKRAKVAFTSEFSGHGKASQMLKFLQQFKNIQTVLLTHGNLQAKDDFEDTIREAGVAKQVASMNRQDYYRLTRWGISEKKRTKF